MSEEPTTGRKRRRVTSLFPKNTLMEALQLAQSIHDNNADEPYNRLDLAKSVNYSPESGRFRLLITSSNRFGLTTGSYGAEKISLTELGKSIVSPKSEQEKVKGLKKALFNIALYGKFFSKYNNRRLPKREYLRNTLNRDFGIPVTDCDKCYDFIIKNARELDIIESIKGNNYIKLSKLMSLAPTEEPREKEEAEEKIEGEEEKEKEIAEKKIGKHRVFISHSKNKKIVNQIKQILNFGQFEYVIAEERETTAIPISEKVFGLMSDCNCAIINVSADEQEKREDETYGINQNVLTEIGAAFLAYNKKVVLLVDKRVKLPSNLHGLYRCEYKGDELSFSTAIKLQKALSKFREL